MSENVLPSGEWVHAPVNMHLKGCRRDPKYYPAIGETCLMSGPNCDGENGYTWAQVEILWRDDMFIVTRVAGCWPTITKLELALFEPLPDPIQECLREAFGAAAPEFVAAFKVAMSKRGLGVIELAPLVDLSPTLDFAENHPSEVYDWDPNRVSWADVRARINAARIAITKAGVQ